MLLRLYSLLVLCWDLALLVLGCAAAIVQSLYQLVWPPVLKTVAGELVLVAGAGRGVGRELAIQFASLGSKVICWDINSDANCATAKAATNTEGSIGNVYAYTCDVTNREQVLAVADRVRRDVGTVTILVHCCSVPSPRSLVSKPSPDIRKTMDLGIMSHFWLLDAFLPDMMKHNHGHILALTSVAGLTGIRDQVPLCASQFAVQGLAEALSEELRSSKSSGRGIRLTLVHIYPFIVGTDMARDIRLRIPSYFGTIDPSEAARQIIIGMRRNYSEMSVPGYLLYLGNLLRILPRKASEMLRELLDTGVDFG